MPKLRYVFCALGLLLSLINFPISNTAAKSCRDLEFIFARGSGESLNDKSFSAWQQEIAKNLSGSKLSYNFYELGSTAVEGFQYPAVAVAGSADGYLNLLGAVISSGESLNFGSSVIEGSQELKHYIENLSTACPSTKFALGGYSQGAMVVSRTLPKLNSEKIIYASTFGDPKLYLPEGQGIMPAACLGRDYSNYRVYVPDCHAYEGVLGSFRPYQPAGYIDKLGTWCNEKDIMCSSGMSLKDHTSYTDAGLYAEAAITIASKIKASFPDQTADIILPDISSNVHNLAIVIDSSGSMSKIIGSYKTEAKKLAKKVSASGGKVALYEYRDLADPFVTVQHCDYSCDYETFVTKLDQIKTDGGGDDDESALSAILYAMNSLKWQVGATKSIVLLTDAKYLAPDRDGVTLAEVTKRSLEIDPVNVYTITTAEQQEFYQELSAATNGAVFDIKKDLTLSTETILSRPIAILPNFFYEARVGETLRFDASASYVLGDDNATLIFDWDLDGDGKFELENGPAVVESAYTDVLEQFIQVRVRNARNDTSSTMSAQVNIIAQNQTPATISELSTHPLSSRSAEIFFQTDAEQLLLIVDDTILGFVDPEAQSLVLEDVTSTHEVTLIPYREQRRGESRSISVQPLLPTAPNTGAYRLETGFWTKFRQIGT